MAGNLLGSAINVNYVDKRRSPTPNARSNSHNTGRRALYTANGAGSTTTLVGAAAVLTTSVNVARIGERFRLFASAVATSPKEETVFTVTAVDATGALVTFSPAAAVATASGNVARVIGDEDWLDETSIEVALLAAGYTQTQLNTMTQNDKVWALRNANDPSGI